MNRALRLRTPLWKLALVLLALMGFVLLGLWAWIGSVASRKWSEMECQVDALLARAKSRNASRPILRGAAREGNAWMDYGEAIDKVAGSGASLEPGSVWLKNKDLASLEGLRKIKEGAGTALLDLRRGVQRTEGQHPCRWDEVHSWIEGPPTASLRALIALGVLEAQSREDLGRPIEAAEILLDLCQFARDASENGTLLALRVGIYHYEFILGELRRLLLSSDQKQDVAALLARELRILDGSFPRPGLTLENELIVAGQFFKYLRSEPETLGTERPNLSMAHWRYGFSFRLRVTSAWSELRDYYLRASEASRGPWSTAQRIGQEILESYDRTRNEVVGMALRPDLRQLSPVWGCLGHLRLLRVASEYLARGELLELDDPFGAKLHAVKAGDKLRIWSNGPDGFDHGGTGGWEPKSGQDLLFEVKR